MAPDGTASTLATTDGDGGGEATVLTFLTSSCFACLDLWDGYRSDGAGGRMGELPRGLRVAVVTPGAALEDRRKVAILAPPGLPVVMSAEAWEDYGVTGSPFAVVVRDGRVVAEAPLSGWDDLAALVTRAR